MAVSRTGPEREWVYLTTEHVVVSNEPEAPQPSEATLRVYPNPASDVLVVKSSVGLMEIFDVLGRRVLTARSDNGETVINIAALPTGVYVVRASGQSRVITVRR